MIIGYKKSNILIYFLVNQFYSIENVIMFVVVVRNDFMKKMSLLKEPKQLPSVIAIDEYKGDAGGEKYQTIIADPVDRRPLDILPDRRKLTVQKYLQQHGGNVNMVVMDMSPSFKAAVSQALDSPI